MKLKGIRKSLAVLLLIGLLISAYPIYQVFAFRYYYGEAEQVAEVLRGIAKDTSGEGIITKEKIMSVMRTRKYDGIEKYNVKYPDSGEAIVLVAVNSKFTIGLSDDGLTLWNPQEQ